VVENAGRSESRPAASSWSQKDIGVGYFHVAHVNDADSQRA
jgi:hypothetical protein